MNKTLKNLTPDSPEILKVEFFVEREIDANKIRTTWGMQMRNWEKLAAFVFGVAFIITLIVVAIFFPEPTPFQYTVFRVVLSMAAAGVAAIIPGMIKLQGRVAMFSLTAGGAIAVFCLVYLINPVALLTK